MLTADDPGLVSSLLLLSYPLHPPRRAGELRTAHFPRLRVPALFVHGTRDGFGSIEEMEAALKLTPVTTQLLQLTAAGHELLTKRNRDEAATTIVDTFCSFAGIR
jgi:hypothetical protein